MSFLPLMDVMDVQEGLPPLFPFSFPLPLIKEGGQGDGFLGGLRGILKSLSISFRKNPSG
jgi:hypothetical protein